MTAGSMRTDTVELIFEGNGPVSAQELGSFLYFFRAVYAAGVLRLHDHESIVDHRHALDIISGLSIKDNLTKLWFADLGGRDLLLDQISKQSPLKILAITQAGCMAALTLAIIISGGQADLKKMTFNLPPLGTGIALMREAISGTPPNSPFSKVPHRPHR